MFMEKRGREEDRRLGIVDGGWWMKRIGDRDGREEDESVCC
jgi:hypothetical protein